MTKDIAICWFRNDLRLSDNPALTKAVTHKKVLPIYIVDDDSYPIGAASRWWLHHSLLSLSHTLGGNLSLYKGGARTILVGIIRRFGITAVYWNRCYEHHRMERDTEIKTFLKSAGIKVESSNGSLLWEPWTMLKNDGEPYKVFTPFYRKGCLQSEPPRMPLPMPKDGEYTKDDVHSLSVDGLELLSHKSWEKRLARHWEVGSDAALGRLQRFIQEGLPHYKKGRDFPAMPYVSRLSPHLHFGEISAHQVWHQVRTVEMNEHVDHFCSELGWREFAYHQLYHNPELPWKNLQSKFDAFPWDEDETVCKIWQRGQTGIPLVDAGLRELWQTGYLHNRVRMVVGSFLVKNLLIHWHHGERWFWDTLVDADLANNSTSWQWIAGCGVDAAPYFRIFNPVTQGQKFDPDGTYIRTFVPEIKALPNKYLFSPWQAPASVLQDANITLGTTYPIPIVDLKQSRERALAAFQSLK